jgi:hypothetical protein
MPSIINAATSGGLISTADTSGVLQLQTASTNALSINASQQVQVNTGGSAVAPVISKSDDTNTGIFFPAADTIAFSEGGTESMRIDSSGNVGIGVTPTFKLDVMTSGGPSIIRNTTYRAAAGQCAWSSQFARGTSSSPTIVLNGDSIASFEFYPYNGTNFSLQTAAISALVTGTVTSSSIPTSILFNTDAAGLAYDPVNERMRINQFGVGIGTAVPTSGMGITFPATQSASSNANTLDDYEEGSWTPVVTGLTTAPVGVTYSGQNGRYVKVGSVVHVFCDVTLNSVGTTGAGRVAITGIPFTSDGNSIFNPCAAETEALLNAITTQLVPLVPPVTSRVEFYAGWNGTGGPTSVDYATHMKSGTILRFYVCFRST